MSTVSIALTDETADASFVLSVQPAGIATENESALKRAFPGAWLCTAGCECEPPRLHDVIASAGSAMERANSARRSRLADYPPEVLLDNATKSLARRIRSPRSISRYCFGNKPLLVHSRTATRFCKSISVG